jgi:cytochrome c553
MPKHIVRLLALLVLTGAAALLAKAYFTPDSFYRFGHYRADSVAEIAAQDPVFQTPPYCEPCHGERVATWSANSHKTVICETCHGAAKDHPANGKLPVPSDTRKLCTLCHEAMPGRPRAQPQVDVAVHAGNQQCTQCHNPHAPKIGAAVERIAGDAAAGRKRAMACAACHGEDGVSANDSWPTLAGQHPAYLARILAAFRSGDQKDAVMTPIAKSLAASDVQDLAVYYGGLGCKASRVEAQVGDVAAGGALAKNCAACHGDTGLTANPAWPRIAGQKPVYLVNVMKAFRAGLRKDPTMSGVARGLSDTDISNLAAYFAAQRCEPVTQTRRTP